MQGTFPGGYYGHTINQRLNKSRGKAPIVIVSSLVLFRSCVNVHP